MARGVLGRQKAYVGDVRGCAPSEGTYAVYALLPTTGRQRQLTGEVGVEQA